MFPLDIIPPEPNNVTLPFGQINWWVYVVGLFVIFVFQAFKGKHGSWTPVATMVIWFVALAFIIWLFNQI